MSFIMDQNNASKDLKQETVVKESIEGVSEISATGEELEVGATVEVKEGIGMSNGKRTYVIEDVDEKMKDIEKLDDDEVKKEEKILSRSERKKSVIRLLKTLHYDYVRSLGKGAFGDVVLMRNQVNKEIAVKIVKTDDVSEGEMSIWHRLEQQNVLRLESIFVVPSLNVVAFEMPLQKSSFFEVALDPSCMGKKNIMELMKLWIVDMLRGLQYLHQHGLCHLDMKVDNVLISKANIAVISDFTFLRRVKGPTKHFGIPAPFCPPEACPRFDFEGNALQVDGFAADMWCMGMTAVDCLTKLAFYQELETAPYSWSTDIYRTMFSILQAKKLRSLVENAFPSTKLDKRTLKVMRNFLLMLLNVDPDKRPSAEKALTHKFLCEGSFMSKEDNLWKSEAESFIIDNLITKYRRKILSKNFKRIGYKRLPEIASPVSILNEITEFSNEEEVASTITSTKESVTKPEITENGAAKTDLCETKDHATEVEEDSLVATTNIRHHSAPLVKMLSFQLHVQALQKHQSMPNILNKTSKSPILKDKTSVALEFDEEIFTGNTAADGCGLEEHESHDDACQNIEFVKDDQDISAKDFEESGDRLEEQLENAKEYESYDNECQDLEILHGNEAKGFDEYETGGENITVKSCELDLSQNITIEAVNDTLPMGAKDEHFEAVNLPLVVPEVHECITITSLGTTYSELFSNDEKIMRGVDYRMENENPEIHECIAITSLGTTYSELFSNDEKNMRDVDYMMENENPEVHESLAITSLGTTYSDLFSNDEKNIRDVDYMMENENPASAVADGFRFSPVVDNEKIKRDIMYDIPSSEGFTIESEKAPEKKHRFRGFLRWIQKRSRSLFLCGASKRRKF